MDQNEAVKEALKQLPPGERVVALALRSIYGRIKNLHQKEEKQIRANQLEFLDRFKQVEQKTAAIINGKQIEQKQLANVDEYFVEEQKNEVKTLIGTSLPIKEYWLVALKNSRFANLITPEDQKILAFLTNITHKLTDTTVEVSLTFRGSSVINDGVYTRIVELNNGTPVVLKGDSFGANFNLTEGFLFDISRDLSWNSMVIPVFQYFTFFVNELVPFSLRFYLGEIDNQFQEDDEEGDEDEEEEGSQEDGDEEEQNIGQGTRKQQAGARKQ